MTDENHLFRTECPNDFTLVYRRNVVDLHAYVSGRRRSVEKVYFHVLGCSQRRSRLLRAYAQVSFRHFGQGIESGLEISLTSPQHIFEIGCKRHGVESGNKDSFRSVGRICRHVVGTLPEETEQARFQKKVFHLLSCHLTHILLAKIHILLLRIGFHTHAQHFATVATLHHGYPSAHGRDKLDFRMVLVHKQAIPDLHHVVLFDYYLGLHPRKVVRHQCIDSRFLHLKLLLGSFTLEIHVKALT